MNLEKFCLPDETRPHVKTPYNQDCYTYASDGSIIIRVAQIPGYPDGPKGKYPDCSKLPWKHQEITEWNDIPDFSIVRETCFACDGTGRITTCKECGGEGVIEYDSGFNTYEWECKTCDGEGVTPGSKDFCKACHGKGKEIRNDCVFFMGGYLSARYLHLIKTELSGVKLSQIEKDMVLFKFDGGEGILMVMRQT